MKKRMIITLMSILGILLTGCDSSSSTPVISDSRGSDTTLSEPSQNVTGLPSLPEDLKDNLIIHYQRDDQSYGNWALWLWSDGVDGKEYLANYGDDYGAIFAYPLSDLMKESATGKIGLIVKSKGSWDSKDGVNEDRYIELGSLEADKSGNYSVYLVSGISKIYTARPNSLFTVQQALFLDFREIDVLCFGGNAKSYILYQNGAELKRGDFNTPKHEFSISLDSDADLTVKYSVTIYDDDNHQGDSDISIYRLYETREFGEKYNYDGELGVDYSSTSSTFRVWSPLSKKVTLRIYSSGTPVKVNALKGDDDHQDYEMSKGEKGVFSTSVKGDLEGKYYTYLVTNAYHKEAEVVDPYAKSCGINGLRGMIVDFDKTNPEGWDNFTRAGLIDRKALTVYETHVSDVTSSSTWNGSKENQKKFLGLCEENTTYSENGVSVSTGFDHIRELGVNAIQLQPIFDQADDETLPSYNWGYNPLNYNCLEGSYSSDPYDGYCRIKEFKKVVKAYQDNGINIIMDVVYNHTNSVTDLNFDVLCPYYYYRYDGKSLSNGSGCGNETASDHYMFSKFMKDSTSFWLKEYKLGGFRFDLMALHDLTTMNELTAKLQEINPSVVVYGEPWTGGSTTLSSADSASQSNAGKYEGYGQFNDQYRDALIMSGMKGDGEAGFVTNKVSSSSSLNSVIYNGIAGSTYNATTDPDKSVNYVTCHDNYTLYDRFTAFDKANSKTEGHTDFTPEEKEKMNVLANSMVFSSQGTSFLLAGEEMLRSKGEDLSVAKNSYNAEDPVNSIDYSLLLKHSSMFTSYQKLIALKQSFAGLHLSQKEASQIDVTTSKDGNFFSYTLSDDSKEYKFIHTNGYGTLQSMDLKGYTLYLDTVDENKSLTSSTPLEHYETLIAYKTKA